MGILGLERSRGEEISKNPKKSRKRRTFRLRHGGAAAMARRPPLRNSLQPPFSPTGDEEQTKERRELISLEMSEERERELQNE